MHILDLPSEIIQKILDRLDSRNLYEAAFVCKRWNEPALQRWYNYKICLNNDAFKTVMGLLKHDSEERDKYFQYTHLVKQLELCIYFPSTKNTDAFWEPYIEGLIQCLEYFPSLTVLDIMDANFANRCYKRIASTPPIKGLQNIQDIESVKYTRHHDISRCDHFKACYLYRTTITKMTTVYIKYLLDGRDTFDLLKEFTQLSELKISISTDGYIGLNDIFAISPKLKIFDSIIYGDMPIESIKIFLRNKPSKNNINTCLNTLKLHMMSSISANYLRYITDYISLQLQSVDLKLDRTSFKNWFNEVGEDNALRFAEKLSKMNRFRLSWPVSDENSQVLRDMNRSSLKNFFKFVKAFETDKNTFIRSTFNTSSNFRRSLGAYNIRREPPRYQNNWIEYDRKTGYNVQYKLKSSDYNSFKYKPSKAHVKQEDVASPADIDGLQKFNSIKFNFLNEDMKPDGLFEILQLVLIYCPNLEFFQYDSLHDKSAKFNHITIGADLDHLESDRHVEYYHQMSTETKENLRSVKFDNVLPSQKLLDLLLTYLPYIETFAILGTDPDHVRVKKSVIDLTGFKELDSVYIEVEQLSVSPQHYFIHLQYTDDNDKSYYYYQSSEYPTSLKSMESASFHMCVDGIIFTRVVTIKCKKNIKVAIGAPMVGVLAEIVNGYRFSYISDGSRRNYRILKDGFKRSKQ